MMFHEKSSPASTASGAILFYLLFGSGFLLNIIYFILQLRTGTVGRFITSNQFDPEDIRRHKEKTQGIRKLLQWSGWLTLGSVVVFLLAVYVKNR